MKAPISAILCLALLMVMGAACSEKSGSSNECTICTEPPSSEASVLFGALGRFRVKPSQIDPDYPWYEGQTTVWQDTDGVAPQVAGCHIEINPVVPLSPRNFGELCTEDGLLVETNPNVDELHNHTDDLGAPDVFNCNTFCMGYYETGGSCVETVETPTAEFPCDTSATCECVVVAPI